MRPHLTVASWIVLLAAPAAARADTLTAGDTCTVVVKDAPLQKGADLVVRIPKGTRLTVDRTREGWVRTSYRVGDQVYEGWIEAAFLAPAPKFDATRPAKFSAGYERMAQVVCRDLKLNPAVDPKKKLDTAAIIAEMKELIKELKAVEGTESGELKPPAKEILAEVEFFMKVMRSIGEHPDQVGLPRDQEGGVALRVGVQPRPFVDLSVERKEIKPDESLPALLGKMVHSYDELRALSLRLAKTAKKTGGPPVERGQALAIDFDVPYVFEGKAYDGAFGARDHLNHPDRVRLTNAADVSLTQCTVVVKMVGEAETRYNVHYVADWPRGQTLTAFYYAGFTQGEKSVLRETCQGVNQLVVSIWADQLSQADISYAYDAREKEFAFREYVTRATIVGRCERYKGLLENGYRVNVSFAASPGFPAAKLTIRVKRDGEWSEQTVTKTWWRPGAVVATDFADVGGRDLEPSEFEVVFEATHLDLSHSRHLTWKNE